MQATTQSAVTTSVVLAPEQLAALREIARAEDRSVSSVVRLLLREAIERRGPTA
jgi:hypothetical protein